MVLSYCYRFLNQFHPKEIAWREIGGIIQEMSLSESAVSDVVVKIMAR